MSKTSSGLRAKAGRALAERDLDAKRALVRELRTKWEAGALADDTAMVIELVDVSQPGRPGRPELVPQRGLARRRLGSEAGRIAAIHAVTHIEANAINLALDAAHRFAGMPKAYYDDWLRVADEEALHFGLLADRLAAHGAAYGDLPAHDGLWAMAVQTADDPLRRMALVPRVLEARGLDVTPGMQARFADIGDHETAVVLQRIFDDEVGHVAIGSRWFAHLCEQQGLEPEATFRHLLAEEGITVFPPVNVEARGRAGFSAEELAGLVGS